jgi:cytoskeletal protein CcmA (bactofilin family)
MSSNLNIPFEEFKHLGFSIFGEGNFFKGDQILSGHVIIAGHVEGKITFEKQGQLVIERNGKFIGHIQGDQIEIAGEFSGEIYANGTVVLFPGAIVSGKISSRKLSIYPGALADIEAHTID